MVKKPDGTIKRRQSEFTFVPILAVMSQRGGKASC